MSIEREQDGPDSRLRPSPRWGALRRWRDEHLAALYPQALQWARSNRWELAVYSGLVLLAAVMRLWDLGSRAMHHDESLHAWFSWNLSIGNGYAHQPLMHGPLQMEGMAAVFLLFGDSDYTARLLYAVAGTALVGLPLLLRARLGRLGGLFVSAMLALSPTLLYFSRFARNDILMALWTLGLVICMWRYIDEGRNRYLYVAAGLLALAFATKETAFIVTFTLGLYLVLVVTARSWPVIRQGVTVGEVSPPAALMRLAAGAASAMSRGLKMGAVSRDARFLVLLVTLSLPLGAALFGLLQGTPLLSWSGLVLINDEGARGAIGAPARGGLVVAGLVVVALVWISVLMGGRWTRSVWWRYAVVFYAIFILLYTTFFTNIVGIGSGMWQSLGYWLVQQGEGRGGQPWYYYMILVSVYEFLPLVLAVAGGFYYLRRSDRFGHFLVFWAVTTFVLYTIASEKMPWLLVNITMPVILLAGRYVGELMEGIEWRRVLSGGGILLLGAVPLFAALFWRLAFFAVDEWRLVDAIVLVATVAIAIAIAVLYLGVDIARRIGRRNFVAMATVPIAVILLALSVRAAWYASYRHGDIPVEMLVYTQTSPDIARLVRLVEQVGEATGDATGVPITIDGTSGFHWPWWWYLRHYTAVGYPTYENAPPTEPPESSVLLVHSRNQPEAEPVLGDRFTGGTRIKHRWWFPENYRGLTVGKVLRGLVDRGTWRRAVDYFLYRELGSPLGSEDAFVYFSPDFPSRFKTSL